MFLIYPLKISSSLTHSFEIIKLIVNRVINKILRDPRQLYNVDEGKLKCISKILSTRQAA